jgi:hypothetical protein
MRHCGNGNVQFPGINDRHSLFALSFPNKRSCLQRVFLKTSLRAPSHSFSPSRACRFLAAFVCQTCAQTARSGSLASSGQALQYSHRADIRRLDPPLHPLSPQTPPRNHGRRGNGRFPKPSRHPPARRRFHPKPSLQRSAFGRAGFHGRARCYTKKCSPLRVHQLRHPELPPRIEAVGLVRRCEEPLRLLSRCSPHQGTRERACRI